MIVSVPPGMCVSLIFLSGPAIRIPLGMMCSCDVSLLFLTVYLVTSGDAVFLLWSPFAWQYSWGPLGYVCVPQDVPILTDYLGIIGNVHCPIMFPFCLVIRVFLGMLCPRYVPLLPGYLVTSTTDVVSS